MGDQQEIYDPRFSQDSFVLGIQGVLAVQQVNAIRDQLRAVLEEKALRGELHHGVPREWNHSQIA